MGADLVGYLFRYNPDDVRDKTEEDLKKYYDEHLNSSGKGFASINNDEDFLNFDDFKKLHKDFLYLTEEGARDAYFRADPSNESCTLIFAGDMSWGDSPDGFGYTTLDQLAMYDLLDFYGID